MAYSIKPLACDPMRIKGMSEKLLVSHYENNYGGAVNRLNAIAAQLAELDFAKAPGFVINGLKREELIASNSMILHELFFASLGEGNAPEGEFRDTLARDFGSFDRWRAEFSAMGKAQGGGSGWVLLTWSPRDRKLVNQWAMDHTTTLAGATRFWRSICTSTPITWITEQERPPMSMRSWRRSTGQTSSVPTANCVRELHIRPHIRPTELRSGPVLVRVASRHALAALTREVTDQAAARTL
jgi:Fe-Mn family superoxide dismutase